MIPSRIIERTLALLFITGCAASATVNTPNIQTSNTPIALGNAYGTLAAAINFGKLAENTTTTAPGLGVGESWTPFLLATNSIPTSIQTGGGITIQLTTDSADGNWNGADLTTAVDPWTSIVYTASVSNPNKTGDAIVNITGLDSSKSYQIEFLIGEPRTASTTLYNNGEFWASDDIKTTNSVPDRMTTGVKFGYTSPDNMLATTLVSNTTEAQLTLSAGYGLGPGIGALVIRAYSASDTTAPTPDPASFSVAPAADSSRAISMTATTGTDPTGIIEYLFTETSGNLGGTSSAWQTSPSYSDTGLEPSTLYTYTVTLRDSLNNTGTPSPAASATTQSEVTDTTAPTPDPASFSVAPAAVNSTTISMTATTGTDTSGPIEYLFTETSGNLGGTSSAWQTSPSYSDTGLQPSTLYTYTITLRDSRTNTGTPSSAAGATTSSQQFVDTFFNQSALGWATGIASPSKTLHFVCPNTGVEFDVTLATNTGNLVASSYLSDHLSDSGGTNNSDWFEGTLTFSAHNFTGADLADISFRLINISGLSLMTNQIDFTSTATPTTKPIALTSNLNGGTFSNITLDSSAANLSSGSYVATLPWKNYDPESSGLFKFFTFELTVASNLPANVTASRITSIAPVGGGVWELMLSAQPSTGYEFRSSSTLEFNPGTLLENLTHGAPSDAGTILGSNNSVLITDSTGNAKVRLTLTGFPADFVRAQTITEAIGFVPYSGNPVISPGAAGEWDAGALGSMTVIKANNTFHMYYEAWGIRSSDPWNQEEYNSLQIGHATSLDGIHWTKDPANPVIKRGAVGDWDYNGTWDPFVIYEDGVFKMWHGGGNAVCDWGYAESADGTIFQKHGRISQLGAVEDAHVIHDTQNNLYHMFYWNRANEPLALFRATSTNKTDFNFAAAIPVQIAGEDYTNNAKYKFAQVFMNGGTWYMLYGNFVRPTCPTSTVRLASSPDGLNWTKINGNLLEGHDGEIIALGPDYYAIYYGPRNYFDAANCDIRVALFHGKIESLIK